MGYWVAMASSWAVKSSQRHTPIKSIPTVPRDEDQIVDRQAFLPAWQDCLSLDNVKEGFLGAGKKRHDIILYRLGEHIVCSEVLIYSIWTQQGEPD
jgi:hypothetical protein